MKLGTKAVAPVVATLILMAVLTIALGITLTFVQTNLTRLNAENDFNSAKVFMKAVGLQIDDVAWIMGKKGTVQYTAENGQVNLVNQLLKYTIQVKTTNEVITLASDQVGVLFYNVPLSKYYLDNEYYEEILPTKAETLVFSGTTATVARVFAVQKNPILTEQEYIRVVVTPNIRYFPYSINFTENQGIFYVRLYLPNLVLGTEPRTSPSITVSGETLPPRPLAFEEHIDSIIVTVSFPQNNTGFDNTFFHFPSLTQIITIPSYSQTVIELYRSNIQIDIGT